MSSDREEVLKTAGSLQDFGRADPDDKLLDREPVHDLQTIVDSIGLTTIVNPIEVNQFSRAGISTYTPWDQTRINGWQDRIFGLRGVDPLAERGVMDKLDEEVAELRRALEEYQRDPSDVNFAKVRKEMADVSITLSHAAGVCGVVLQKEVDSKMEINEARKWTVNSSGSGRHES